MEFVHAVRAGQVGEFDPDRRMLVLLRVAAEACEPVVVAAHLLGPHPHHRLRHGVGAAQRGQIGGGLVGVGGVQIALPGDPRVAAFLALGRLFQDDDLGAEIVRGDRGGEPRRPEPDDDDIGFDIPGFRDCAHRLVSLSCRAGRIEAYDELRLRSAPDGLAAGPA